jgi:hypothetical protein
LLRFDIVVDKLNDNLKLKENVIIELQESNSNLNKEILKFMDEKQKTINDNFRQQKHVQELTNYNQNLDSQIKLLYSKDE